MRTSPLRVALWCVVVLAFLAFVRELRRPDAPPLPAPQQIVEAPRIVEAPPPVRTLASVPEPEPLTGIAPPAGPTDAKAAYVGNVNTYKFHRTSCHYATCKNCTARFATREEALAAGFRSGGCCDP